MNMNMNKLRAGAAVLVVGGTLAATGAIALATPQTAKVTICHRTASHTNPYVRITVAQDSVDGNLANDKGQGDHYLEHLGPIGPISVGEWGDIIPPIAGVHDGRNWSATGQAIYMSGCGKATPTTTVPASTTTVDPTLPEPT